MREIKFRAWDIHGKQMWYVSDLLFFHDELQVVGCGFMASGGKGFARAEVELMQFTGLKDHAGKEIYEGDLVRRVNGTTDKVDEIVYAADGYCGFMRRWPNGTLDWINPGQLEVVGNIHEHAELVR